MEAQQIDCPYCDERKGTPDTKKHLYIYPDSKGVHCFRCEFHTNDEIPAEVRALIEGSEFGSMLLDAGPEGRNTREWPQDISVLLSDARPARKFREALGYLRKRGITDEEMESLGILYAPRGRYEGRVIFPIRDEAEKVVYYVARTVREDVVPTYINAPGPKNGYLYIVGTFPARKGVIVEGVFDAFAVARAGYPALALLGKRINTQQKYQIATMVQSAIVLLDPDALSCGITVANELSHYVPTRWKELPPNTDPDMIVQESGPDALRAIIESELTGLGAQLAGVSDEEAYRGTRRVRRKPDNDHRSAGRKRGQPALPKPSKLHRVRPVSEG